MSILDDDLDVNESDLLAKICLWYFEKYGYWKFNEVGDSMLIYSCDIDSFYRHADSYEVIKTPEKYGLFALPSHRSKSIKIMTVPLEGLENQYIISRLCRVKRPIGVNDTMTIKDILECYESIR